MADKPPSLRYGAIGTARFTRPTLIRVNSRVSRASYPCHPGNPRCSETFLKIFENFDLQIPEKDSEMNTNAKVFSAVTKRWPLAEAWRVRRVKFRDRNQRSIVPASQCPTLSDVVPRKTSKISLDLAFANR